MRIAFYAPLKPPTHPVPSGDRQVARLLLAALGKAGHETSLASTLRTHDPQGNASRQQILRDQGMAEAATLIERWREPGIPQRPEIWFTYHVYYKAPDWLGPAVSAALGIPYVIAEASHAPKRANGPWALGHAAAEDAIRAADLPMCSTQSDLECVKPLVSPPAQAKWLPPFVDAAPYRSAAANRDPLRTQLAAQHRLDPSIPWIAVVAMMRTGDKLDSYRMLACALANLLDLPWHVLVIGEGEARGEVEQRFESAAPGRARFLGERREDDVAALYAACDLCLWPAVNEAYGMAMLEAQAAGLAVVSRSVRGVPDVVRDGETGLLAPADDDQAFSNAVRSLLVDAPRRAAMGKAAAAFAGSERSLESTAKLLQAALEGLAQARRTRPAEFSR